ncbi:PREDICTED: apolipoprotein L5 [Ceratotherium simum simum]|uniref:Apolipoprotein L5 n=1 Tax=Ceratotherium simum simum TaxID=73337 RepID=A0ABM0H383_CERSS|nr:PREDICTED: apolipoprotein L5 [Ceratotherium simum simum]
MEKEEGVELCEDTGLFQGFWGQVGGHRLAVRSGTPEVPELGLGPAPPPHSLVLEGDKLLASLGNLSQNWKNNHVMWIVPRDEANVLYQILFEELMRREQVSVLDGNLSEEEKMFLLCFPSQKHKLEKSIKELNTIADQVDSTHKMLTKTNLVASSSSAVCGVMSILGLALAPVTAGGSLMLSAVGQGLGAAAAITTIFTNVLENRSNSAARDRARILVSIPATEENEALGGIKLSEVYAAGLCVNKCASIIKSIRQLHAYRMAKANSGFTAMVKNFMATGRVPFWRATGVQRAIEGPAQAMTRGARVMGAAGAGFLLMQDVNSLLQNWRHLEEGAKAGTAEELRTCAKELEQRLGQLTQRYERIIWKQCSVRRSCPPLPLPVMEHKLRPSPGRALKKSCEKTQFLL